MEYVNYVILGGQQYVTKEEKHIVVHLTMHLHKFYKEYSMTILLIYGV